MLRRLFCTLSLVALLAASAAADKKKIVPPDRVPQPGAPPARFSPGILVDGTLYVSGQMGSDPKTAEFPDNFEDEVKLALNNVGAVLKAAGMKYDDVVAVTVYLSDMSLFQRMNTVYLTYFKEPLPTRSTVGVAALASPKGHIEITVTAHKP
jgi:2-iminobutanoate/2-iminopropanoate deaminase